MPALDRAAGTYEDLRSDPYHVFRILRETSKSFHKNAKFFYDLQNPLKSIESGRLKGLFLKDSYEGNFELHFG